MNLKKVLAILILVVMIIFILLIIIIYDFSKFNSNEDEQNERLANIEYQLLEEKKSRENLCQQQIVDKTSDFLSEYYQFDLANASIFSGKVSDEEMGDYQLCFKANVDNFDEIKIGKGYGKYCQGMYLLISKEKVKIFNAKDDSLLKEYDLKVKIEDYISVNIMVDLRDNARIELFSNNGSQIFNTNWSARRGTVFVITNENSQLSDCQLSYYCNGWNKPIWILGDSYLHNVASNRWTSYLTEKGYDNYLLNGYPGRGSSYAMESLKNMLNYSTPKEIVWCLGMNDGDDADEINANWLENVEELMTICEENNITLVLTTIPNCPTINNEFKNAYIKSSGYKYIDFAKAVGASEDSIWFEGMLESGDAPCHPTETGAWALYSEAVATCPELLN